jgi:four helix bundle protein
MKGYVGLKVWSKAMDLAALVYKLGPLMPKTEQFGMTVQMQRAVASIPANIAEGYQRGTRKDYSRFISIARGSLAETETFLLLANRVGHLSAEQIQPSVDLADELSRMLTRLKQRLDVPEGAPE